MVCLIGVLVAACPAIAYGWLYYKELEKIKQRELLYVDYKSKALVPLSAEATQELRWWLAQIPVADNKIRSMTFDLEIFSDASLNGWGARWGEEEFGRNQRECITSTMRRFTSTVPARRASAKSCYIYLMFTILKHT